MQAPKQQRLDAYLKSAKDLAPLAAHAARLADLQRIFEAAAPAYLAASGRVTNYKQGKLFIHAINGAAAAKLKQILPRLADEFLCQGVEVSEVIVRAQPPLTYPTPAARVKRVAGICSSGKQTLTDLIRKLPDGDPLKDAVERLVARG